MPLTNEQKTEVINHLDNTIDRAVESTMDYLQDMVNGIRRQKADSGLKNKDIISIGLVPENYIQYRILMSEERRGIIETLAKVKIVEVKPFPEDEVDETLEHLAVGYGIDKEN